MFYSIPLKSVLCKATVKPQLQQQGSQRKGHKAHTGRVPHLWLFWNLVPSPHWVSEGSFITDQSAFMHPQAIHKSPAGAGHVPHRWEFREMK